ncbi:DNA-processing protein DprA [Methanobrevibacter sp.]|uniref:DNA-processing protein DprA n=1 Tax=Methanobrevibacter sp. TaxID=66852 RepID=UPI003863E4CF
MKKFKEIIFLNSIKGVAKKTIYNQYWDMLNEADDFYDLVSEVELNSKFKIDDIKNAMRKAEELYDYIITSDIDIITVFDDNYPEKLNIMGKDRPLILYIKGDINALTKPNIAFIGTRKPSQISEEFEKQAVEAILNSSNRVIVSGLALGCDKVAHQTTVDKDKVTIAVLPSGVDVIKPAKHKKLAKEILETGGCLISEYVPNKTPYKSEYVERDKIVAAFSDATFVVECGIESGTMHTVDAASDYGRKIYSYLPEDTSVGSFDGNEFILKNKPNSMKIQNIKELITDLDDLKINNNDNYSNKSPKTFQSSLM